jgi:hypothetical protein
MEIKLTVNSVDSLLDFVKNIFAWYKQYRYLTISVRNGEDRTAKQNALWAAIYKRIGQETGWGFQHARAHCKWYFGIPILKRDFENFELFFDKAFKNVNNIENCLGLMNATPLFPKHGFPVTRNFNRKQGVEYTENIIQEFSNEGIDFNDLLDKN